MARRARTAGIGNISSGQANRNKRREALARCAMELLEGRVLFSVGLVTTNADSGPGSLRQAILDANAAGSPAVISFSLPSGSDTIAPLTALPALSVTTTIDGATQPGYAGVPLVELNGAAAGPGANGLEFDARGSALKGLVINRFAGDGVLLASAGGDSAQGNYIGTDLSGKLAEPNGTGIAITSPDNVVRGNVISGNQFDGVKVTGDSNTVAGNLIGTDVTGTLVLGNASNSPNSAGITVDDATHTTVGGTTPADRNIISGNLQDGVAFINIPGLAGPAGGDVVEGNYIGTDITGELALGNGANGVDLGTTNNLSASGVTVGGATAGAGNVISANSASGIYFGASSGNFVEGNLIGTDALGQLTGFDAAANPLTGNQGNGITIDQGSGGNQIGGTTASARNVISGNWGNGVLAAAGAGFAANVIEGNYIGTDLSGASSVPDEGSGIGASSGPTVITNNVISSNYGEGIALTDDAVVRGNLIGTMANGVSPLGNAGDGILVRGSNNQIGGAGLGQANVIAFNADRGISIVTGIGNSMRGNSIFSNATLGIDLGNDGPTPNDAQGHTGANNYQNFPVLSTAVNSGGTLTITGTLHSAPGQSFTIDFYSNAAADPSGYGQGQTYIGSATVSSDAITGVATFTATLNATPAGQTFVSATATDAAGNTSEFAPNVAQTVVVVTPPSMNATTTTLGSSANPSVFGQTLTLTATVAGGAGTSGEIVTFMEGSQSLGTGTLDSNGHAFLTPSSLAVGSHQITAAYAGDAANAASSSAPLSQVVSQAATATALTSSANPSTVGQVVTFTATVAISGLGAGSPTGAVTFMDGSMVLAVVGLSGNTASFSTSALAIGDHVITAAYGGDASFAGSSATPLAQTVKAAPASISGRTLNDVTGNGLSADDTALGGITVKLYLDRNGNGVLDAGDGAPIATTISDARTGVYSFTSLAQGTYLVQEVTPANYVRTAPISTSFYALNIQGGASATNEDFDNYQKGCSCGLSNVYFVIDGTRRVSNLRGNVHQGDTVQVKFTVLSGHMDTLSLVSYTAPGATFVASQASKQKIYNVASGSFGAGTWSLTVVIPPSYFQVDFVCGYAIDQFGTADSNIFYSAEGRLISADNGGTTPPKNLTPLN